MLDLRKLDYDDCDRISGLLASAATGQAAREAAAEAFKRYSLISYAVARGTTYWRCRRCSSAQGFQTTDELSHPPADLTPLGRLNESNQPLLYCSTNPLTALNEIRAADGDYVHAIAYRHWPQAETRLASIGDVHRLFRTRRLNVSVESRVSERLLADLRRQASDESFMPSLYLDALLAHCLADANAEDSRYRATRAIASEVLEKREEIEGLMYPSVQEHLGYNAAFKPTVRNKLSIVASCMFHVDRKRRLGFYEIRLLKSAMRITHDNRFEWGEAENAPLECMRVRFFGMTEAEALADQAEHQEAGMDLTFARE